jgi:hypothetical protein
MSVTNVKSNWVGGDLYFYDAAGLEIFHIDGTNRKFVIPSGSVIEVPGSVLAASDIALAEGSILVGDSGGAAVALDAKTTTRILVGNGTTLTSVAMSADATMANTGAVTIANSAVNAAKLASNAVETAKIADAAVTSGKLANGAGVAAILTAGLGGSGSYIKTKNDTTDLVAAHGTKDRAVLVVVTVDQAFADNAANLQPTFSVGEAGGAVDEFVTVASLVNKTLGVVQVYQGLNTATRKIQVTGVAASGDGSGTGAISVTVLAIPTT